ncbi:MAG: hypothetical protein JNM72_07855 [Deltaproteobacteria bacterium]|jgi:hypothetical protein|nr:hypothetical protein [Deltaproteobacteria bacterium]
MAQTPDARGGPADPTAGPPDDPPEDAPTLADPPLGLSHRLAWVALTALVLLAVAGMVLVYWPGLQLSRP